MLNIVDKMLQQDEESRNTLKQRLNISSKSLTKERIDFFPQSFIGSKLSSYLSKYDFNPDLRPKVENDQRLILRRF